VYNEDTELIFPIRVAPALRTLHGPGWRKAVDQAAKAQPDSPTATSFVLATAATTVMRIHFAP